MTTVGLNGYVKDWWPTLKTKLTGHYQYYGVSGNSRSIEMFYRLTRKLAFKWLNRRSQRKSFDWKGFEKYLDRFGLPRPRVTCKFYTLPRDREIYRRAGCWKSASPVL